MQDTNSQPEMQEVIDKRIIALRDVLATLLYNVAVRGGIDQAENERLVLILVEAFEEAESE